MSVVSNRGLQLALDVIPGARAAQFATGRELVTGQVIDRGNRLQQVLAGASLLAGTTGPYMPVAGVIQHGQRIPETVRTLLTSDRLRSTIEAATWLTPIGPALALWRKWQ